MAVKSRIDKRAAPQILNFPKALRCVRKSDRRSIVLDLVAVLP